jgi:hypothetical protein
MARLRVTGLALSLILVSLAAIHAQQINSGTFSQLLYRQIGPAGNRVTS